MKGSHPFVRKQLSSSTYSKLTASFDYIQTYNKASDTLEREARTT